MELFARNDIQGYHGLVRVDTGLAIVDGLVHLDEIADAIQCPVSIHHGTADRVTDPAGSRMFYDRMRVEKKSLRLWPSWEHGMYCRGSSFSHGQELSWYVRPRHCESERTLRRYRMYLCFLTNTVAMVHANHSRLYTSKCSPIKAI